MKKAEKNLNETEKNVSSQVETDPHSDMDMSVLKRDLPMYDILSVIGKGANGLVFKALHIKLGRKAAIKMLKPEFFSNVSLLENLRKEAQLLSRIKHENVASVYDFIETNNRYYLIMELIEGISLAELIKESPPDQPIIFKIICGLLEGIRFTHNKNILHLDIKPSNIILNEFSEPVIIDFGLSRFKSHTGRSEKEFPVLGTPYYMSPEQFVRSVRLVDRQSDIYSIGVIFYQLLTGGLPFTAENFKEIRNKVIFEEPVRPSLINKDISLDLEAIILKMMHKTPQERYTDAQAVIEDLRRYDNGEPVRAQKYHKLFLLWKWMRRNKIISSLIFLVIFVSMFFSGYISYKKYQETPHWIRAFSDNFNTDFYSRWQGYLGIKEGYLTAVSSEQFNKYFCSRIKSASFKKDMDLVLATSETFDENIRFEFSLNVNAAGNSIFGFFINASLPEPELGYIICSNGKTIKLVRDNLSGTPLWSGVYEFKSDQVYSLSAELVDGNITLFINNEKIFEFHDFVTWFSKKEYRVGFFSQETDLEVDNVYVYQLNTALLITPLDIGNRFFQLGRFEDAIDEYTRVINKHTQHKIAFEAYYLRGLTKQKCGRLVEAIRDFELLFANPVDNILKGKSWYQKGVCELYLNNYRSACRSFDEAMKVYNIPSLRSNILNTLVTLSREKLGKPDLNGVSDAEHMILYLLNMNIPSRITFVDILKKIVLCYFDNEEYEKSIRNLDLLIKHYSLRKDILAFALWKKGRAYMELAKTGKDDNFYNENVKKAIYCFRQVLLQCPEVRFYNYYAHEELAKACRATADFKMANEYEKKKNAYNDIFL